jgi:hypothetical protein
MACTGASLGLDHSRLAIPQLSRRPSGWSLARIRAASTGAYFSKKCIPTVLGTDLTQISTTTNNGYPIFFEIFFREFLGFFMIFFLLGFGFARVRAASSGAYFSNKFIPSIQCLVQFLEPIYHKFRRRLTMALQFF